MGINHQTIKSLRKVILLLALVYSLYLSFTVDNPYQNLALSMKWMGVPLDATNAFDTAKELAERWSLKDKSEEGVISALVKLLSIPAGGLLLFGFCMDVLNRLAVNKVRDKIGLTIATTVMYLVVIWFCVFPVLPLLIFRVSIFNLL